MKKFLVFFLMLVIALVVGGLAGQSAGIDWLSYSKGFSISTTTVDLSVLTVSFGIQFSMNVAQLILIIIVLFTYPKVCKALGV